MTCPVCNTEFTPPEPSFTAHGVHVFKKHPVLVCKDCLETPESIPSKLYGHRNPSQHFLNGYKGGEKATKALLLAIIEAKILDNTFYQSTRPNEQEIAHLNSKRMAFQELKKLFEDLKKTP